MDIDLFEMERMQSLYWHLVDYDLSESGVTPMTIRELLGPAADAEAFLQTALGYPLSEGSYEARANIAAWYPDATAENVTLSNGGSEANHLTLWTLLEPDDRLAFMIPNYMQGWGLGRHFGKATDTFKLKLQDGRWQLDLDQLERAVTKRTKVVMVCNPNNPTGYVLTSDEMDAVVAAADRVGAWIVSDEIYRGAEVDVRRGVADVLGPLRQGRRDERAVEGVRDAGTPARVDARAAGAHPRHVGPSRLHDADAVGDLGQARGVRDGPDGAREHLRPDARDHPREPARTSRRGSANRATCSRTRVRSRGRSRT